MEIDFDYIDFDQDKLNHLLKGIGKYFGIDPVLIFTKKRKKNISKARQMFILICSTTFELTIKQMAMVFEYSDTGIVSALKVATLLSEHDVLFKARYQRILEHVNL